MISQDSVTFGESGKIPFLGKNCSQSKFSRISCLDGEIVSCLLLQIAQVCELEAEESTLKEGCAQDQHILQALGDGLEGKNQIKEVN